MRPGSLKSGILKMAAEIIGANTSFLVPALYFTHGHEYLIYPKKSVLVNEVKIKPIFDPDHNIISILSPQFETELLVEILVRKRNTFTVADYNWLKEKSVYCIEIDARSLTLKEIHNDGLLSLVKGIDYKQWVYHPIQLKIESYLKRTFSRSKQIKNEKVSDCPLMQRNEWNTGRSHALKGECRKCKYCVVKEDIDLLRQINCVGHMHDRFASCIQEAIGDRLPTQPSLF
jgi:hypothetical protein